MCWGNADWTTYRTWKTELDSELFALAGRSLVDIMESNEDAGYEADEITDLEGNFHSLYEFTDYSADDLSLTMRNVHEAAHTILDWIGEQPIEDEEEDEEEDEGMYLFPGRPIPFARIAVARIR